MQITINKIGTVVDVDFDKLPANSQEFIKNYGIRQILNDCHSSTIRKDFDTQEAFVAEVSESVNVKIAALVAGDLAIRRGGASLPSDPVEREVLSIAREEIKNALRSKKNLSIKAFENANGEGSFDKLVQANITKNADRLTKSAKANIAKAAQAPAVDLDDLLAE